MESSWEALGRHRTLVCILNTFPLSHRWKRVDNMTDYERRLTQKTERYMTQSEHKRLCGLRRCRFFCGNYIRHRNTPRDKKDRKKIKPEGFGPRTQWYRNSSLLHQQCRSEESLFELSNLTLNFSPCAKSPHHKLSLAGLANQSSTVRVPALSWLERLTFSLQTES